ncbi:MAG: preprotein translocase subunit SecG [Pseudomonadota bacterium]
MTNVILVAHILVSIVLVVVVLMQRSEGGALGIGGGGGGGGGGLMTGSGVTGALVRTTIIFGAIFFISSLTLTTIATHENSDGRTDVQRELENSVTMPSETDDNPLNDFDDILSGEGSLLDDPLAVTPSEPPSEADPSPSNDDPLASEADPS